MGAPATKRARARQRVPATEVEAAIDAVGVGRRTYKKARRDLGVRWRKRGFQGSVELFLIPPAATTEPEPDPDHFIHGAAAVEFLRARDSYRRSLGGRR